MVIVTGTPGWTAKLAIGTCSSVLTGKMSMCVLERIVCWAGYEPVQGVFSETEAAGWVARPRPTAIANTIAATTAAPRRIARAFMTPPSN